MNTGVLSGLRTARTRQFRDYQKKIRASTSIVPAATAWANLDTAMDLTLSAVSGDVIEVGASGGWGAEAVLGYIDIVSFVNGAIINAWGVDGPETAGSTGLRAWAGVASVANPIGGVMPRVLLPRDLQGNQVVLRPRIRCGTVAAKTLVAVADSPFCLWAYNLGQ